VSERKRIYNGPTGSRRYIRWIRLDRSTGINRETRRPKRNGITHPRTNRGGTGHSTNSLTHPRWLAYRYIIIGASAFGFTAGLSALVAECVR
jgi:hypothetical protein